jgi:pimeloyl-ACP methyl ester carboxylesterase
MRARRRHGLEKENMSEIANGLEAHFVDEMASNVGPTAIDVAYQRLGDRTAPPVLLIMGAAAQLIHWPDDFFLALANRGLHVIRFDNRDSGLSTHIANAPPPNLPAVLTGNLSSVSYTLSDMAADTVGLMDALGIEKAHLVGASMGGQIAQTIAIEHQVRVRSLVSMMSTTGSMKVGQPAPQVLLQLFAGPRPVTREETIEQRVRAMRAVGSPKYPGKDDEVAARAARAYDRCNDPEGIARQAIATVASGDRTEGLKKLQIPALVIHGVADRMCNVSGGKATAEAIPGAELMLIEGLGHDFPPILRPILAQRIADFVWSTERR